MEARKGLSARRAAGGVGGAPTAPPPVGCALWAFAAKAGPPLGGPWGLVVSRRCSGGPGAPLGGSGCARSSGAPFAPACSPSAAASARGPPPPRPPPGPRPLRGRGGAGGCCRRSGGTGDGRRALPKKSKCLPARGSPTRRKGTKHVFCSIYNIPAKPPLSASPRTERGCERHSSGGLHILRLLFLVEICRCAAGRPALSGGFARCGPL